MTSVFNQIEKLHPTLDGWCELEKAHTLAAITLAMRARTICEIGVFGGKSFFAFALALKHIGIGTAIGIEPWSKEAALQGYEGENREFWNKQVNFESVRKKFFAIAEQLSVGNFIQILESPSDSVEPMRTDLLHVDGQHTTQAVRDVQRFCPLVRVGGLVVMDDIGWNNGSEKPILGAVQWMLSIGGFERLYTLGTGAVFQKTK